MKFELPELPYSYDALEPYLDRRTMEIHHLKHHKAYVTKLNRALEPYPELQNRSLESLLLSHKGLPAPIRRAVRNNGGGHYNHSLFWRGLAPHAGGEPHGEVADAIGVAFGSFPSFREKFTTIAVSHFASGWAWLCVDVEGRLVAKSLPDHLCPITEDLEPIFVMDLWEHAYYLKYQNERKKYVQALWNIVNWVEVNARFARTRTRLPLTA